MYQSRIIAGKGLANFHSSVSVTVLGCANTFHCQLVELFELVLLSNSGMPHVTVGKVYTYSPSF